MSSKTATSTEPVPAELERPPGRGLGGVRSRLRRLGLWPYLAALGPGIIAATAGDDAGGIATYSSVGADYGYRLLWVMVVTLRSSVLALGSFLPERISVTSL